MRSCFNSCFDSISLVIYEDLIEKKILLSNAEIIHIKISIIFLSFAHCQLCLIITHIGPRLLPYFITPCITLFDIQTDFKKEKWHKSPYVYYTPFAGWNASQYESPEMNIEEKPDRALQQAAQRVHGVSFSGSGQSLPGCDPMELALCEPALAGGWTRSSSETSSNPTILCFWGITHFPSLKTTVRRDITVEMLTFPADHSLDGKTAPEAACFRATTSNFHFFPVISSPCQKPL